MKAYFRARREHEAEQDELVWRGIERQVDLFQEAIDKMQEQYIDQQREMINKLAETEIEMWNQAEDLVQQIFARIKGLHIHIVTPHLSSHPPIVVVGPGSAAVGGSGVVAQNPPAPAAPPGSSQNKTGAGG